MKTFKQFNEESRQSIDEKVGLIGAGLKALGKVKLFDIILLDPPCTATGTIGKNPDLQFLNPLDKLDELLDIQQHKM